MRKHWSELWPEEKRLVEQQRQAKIVPRKPFVPKPETPRQQAIHLRQLERLADAWESKPKMSPTLRSILSRCCTREQLAALDEKLGK